MDEDRTLLQTQRNQVFRVIKDAGLRTSEFVWLRRESRYYHGLAVSLLEHRPSRFFYEFDYGPNEYEAEECVARFSPGRDQRVEDQHVRDWEGHAISVRQWANSLTREVAAPDLWASAAEAQSVGLGLVEAQDNTPFSDEERQEIAEGLKQIQDYLVRTHELNREQQAAMSSRLAYLERATNRVGGFDWRAIALSTLITIAWDLGFNPAQARDLFEFCRGVLTQLLTHLPALPR